MKSLLLKRNKRNNFVHKAYGKYLNNVLEDTNTLLFIGYTAIFFLVSSVL